MAQQTLLQMVQAILSRMSSDEVNSISDTTESMQIAHILQNKYYDIVSRGSLAEHDQLFQLSPSNDATKPVLMYVPSGIGRVDWIKYFDSNPADSTSLQQSQFGAFSKHDINVDLQANAGGWSTISTTSNTIALGTKTFTVGANLNIQIGNGATATSGANQMIGTVLSYSGTTLVLTITTIVGSGTYSSWSIVNTGIGTSAPGYVYVNVIGITQFLEMTNGFDPTQTNVGSFTFSDISNNFPGNFTFYFKSDRQPRYCTILSNFYTIFDSYDSSQDTTLQGGKTMCFGQVIPVFNLTDNFVPDLDDQQFPLLLNEAMAIAFFELKQQPNPLVDRELKRQWAVVQKTKSISNKPAYFDQLPNFGRRIGSGGYAVGYPYSYTHQSTSFF